MIELYKADEEEKQLRMCDMEDGQVAVILDNGKHHSYVGFIVQCLGEKVIALGMQDVVWTNYKDNTLPVRLLEDGEMLVFRKEKE